MNACPREPTPAKACEAASPIALKIVDRVPCHSGPLTALLALSRALAMESMGAEPEAMALKTPPRMPPRSKTMSFKVPKVLAAA